MSIKLKDVYTAVATHADTVKQGINAADVSRVLATYHKVLSRLSTTDAASAHAQGLKKAQDKPFAPRARKPKCN